MPCRVQAAAGGQNVIDGLLTPCPRGLVDYWYLRRLVPKTVGTHKGLLVPHIDLHGRLVLKVYNVFYFINNC